MKTTPLIPALFGFLLTFSLNAKNTNELPLDMAMYHYINYPGSEMISWEYKNNTNNVVINFSHNNTTYRVKYNEKFKRTLEHIELSKSDLDPSILTPLENKHGKFKFHSLTKTSSFDKKDKKFLYYRISIKTKKGIVDEYLNEDMKLDIE